MVTNNTYHPSPFDGAAGSLRRRLNLDGDQIVDLVATLRKAGHSYPQIGRMLGCDHSTVIYYARAAGIPKRQATAKERHRNKVARENRDLWDRLIVAEMEIGRLRGHLIRAADSCEADGQHPGLPVFWRDRWRTRAVELVRACKSPFPGVDPDDEGQATGEQVTT